MKASIYLNKVANENLVAYVDLEVCPRGIYQINGVEYLLTGQPRFIISDADREGINTLTQVVLIVEKYDSNRMM